VRVVQAHTTTEGIEGVLSRGVDVWKMGFRKQTGITLLQLSSKGHGENSRLRRRRRRSSSVVER
jgi:hypothetical protein